MRGGVGIWQHTCNKRQRGRHAEGWERFARPLRCRPHAISFSYVHVPASGRLQHRHPTAPPAVGIKSLGALAQRRGKRLSAAQQWVSEAHKHAGGVRESGACAFELFFFFSPSCCLFIFFFLSVRVPMLMCSSADAASVKRTASTKRARLGLRFEPLRWQTRL